MVPKIQIKKYNAGINHPDVLTSKYEDSLLLYSLRFLVF